MLAETAPRKNNRIKKADAAKLGHIDEHEYKVTNTLINHKFIDSDDYIYVEIGDGKYYVIDKDSNLYYVWNNFYTTIFLSFGQNIFKCYVFQRSIIVNRFEIPVTKFFQ